MRELIHQRAAGNKLIITMTVDDDVEIQEEHKHYRYRRTAGPHDDLGRMLAVNTLAGCFFFLGIIIMNTFLGSAPIPVHICGVLVIAAAAGWSSNKLIY